MSVEIRIHRLVVDRAIAERGDLAALSDAVAAELGRLLGPRRGSVAAAGGAHSSDLASAIARALHEPVGRAVDRGTRR